MAHHAQLALSSRPDIGQTFTLGAPRLILGRDPRNDIVIDHRQVSRRHARLTLDEGRWVIEDLESTNGTFVNEAHIMGLRPLADGDVIGLSESVMLRYHGATYGRVGRPSSLPRMDIRPPVTTGGVKSYCPVQQR